MSLVRFENCVLFIDHADTYIKTVFADGNMAEARPQYRAEDVERAHRLGYAGDCWQMCMDHEATHTFVGEIFGFGHSVILWNVAHGNKKRWPEWGKEEEGYTTSLQSWLNSGESDDLVNGLLDKAYERHGLYDRQVFRMLRGLIAEVRHE